MRYRIISILILLSAVSCSVKEDRTDCACILTVDLSPCAGHPDNIFLTLQTVDQCVAEDYAPGVDDPLYEFAVRKGECVLTAYSGGGEPAEGYISVAGGEQFPEAFSYTSRFSALGETASQTVDLHKQYAGITLDLSESGWDSGAITMEVYGDVCGFALADCHPVKGTFYYRIPPAPSSLRYFRVPRQVDNSLKIRVVSGQGVSTELNIGEMLAESGFDWTAQDLGDAVITVSGADGSVSVRASDWDCPAPINVTI